MRHPEIGNRLWVVFASWVFSLLRFNAWVMTTFPNEVPASKCPLSSGVLRPENRAVSSQGVCTPGGENCSSERRFGRIVLPGEERVKGNRKAQSGRAGLTAYAFQAVRGRGFCAVGSRVSREIWVANSAWCWGSVLAGGCGVLLETRVPVLGFGVVRVVSR